MNTINGNFIEKSIPDTKNASIKLTVGKSEVEMSVADFATAIASPSSGPSYKVYTALLNQIGSNPPIATVLENTIGDISFTYISTGTYGINSADLFTLNKTMVATVTFSSGTGMFAQVVNCINSAIDSTKSLLVIKTNSAGFGQVDDKLLNTPIEIRVYN